jgi:hypothetical protein
MEKEKEEIQQLMGELLLGSFPENNIMSPSSSTRADPAEDPVSQQSAERPRRRQGKLQDMGAQQWRLQVQYQLCITFPDSSLTGACPGGPTAACRIRSA